MQTLEQGAKSIVKFAIIDNGEITGKFFQEKEEISW
jgi:hypothetical protein